MSESHESLYDRCRRVWVCKRCGNCLDHCKHQDETNFHEDLAMPCSAKLPVTREATNETEGDPRDMTDDDLRTEMKSLESRLYTLKAEGAKMWRLRLRLGQATEADNVRLAELLKRRAARTNHARHS